MSHRSKGTKLARIATAGLLAAASLVALTSSVPAAAATCAGTAPSDFNGDGISDAAIGSFWVAEEGRGSVNVIYGLRSGLTADASGTALDDQRLTSPTDTTTGFGSALATGDFNGDGCSDLVVGDPYVADSAGVPGAGVVWLYYGSPTGLQTTGLMLDERHSGSSNVANSDNFGYSLAVGDFNGDGLSDIAAGAPNAGTGGAVYVLPGNKVFSPELGAARFRQGDGTVPGVDESGDTFGHTLAAGDFNGDGRSDLAIGAPFENNVKGAVFVVRGGGTLLTSTGSQIWTQDSAGILGTAETPDSFGWSLATGSFKGNGRTDLAIGVRDEGVNGTQDAGSVNVIYSAGSGGLRSTGNQLWTANHAGLPGAAHQGDQWSFAMSAGDFNGDAKTDLAVGSFEDAGPALSAGSVTVIAGGASGLTGTGSSRWTQATPGIAGTPDEGDGFGQGLGVLRVTSADRDDLVVGVPGEQFADISTFAAGEVQLIPGSSAGLTAAGSQVFSADTPGIRGTACQACGFGAAVA